ncbi:MAG: hypothetical protein K8I29_19235 [Alphaproteobacteria bacterium]|uniref:Uncharacterized protein n=1 Tax=Candidatus Nitrobium versatile TaxID=2884831 RepID=A0A953SH15_9BACT|nr:hypothetical protein [Candidatus Nitrobium versatile]
MRYRVPKALNMTLQFLGMRPDDLVVVLSLTSVLIVFMKYVGVRAFLPSIAAPLAVGGFVSYVLKKISEVRPDGYTRHLLHKYGVFFESTKRNLLIAPGRKRYSP